MNKAISPVVLVSAILILLSGCAKYKSPSEDGGGSVPIKQSCPAVKLSDYDSILIHTTPPMPSKVAIILNGVRKYDECASGPIGTAPIVNIERGKNNTATVKVVHYDAYASLPSNLSFDIQNLGDCHTHEALFYRAANVQLTYAEEKPYGPTCGGAFAAKQEIAP
jgi:hypothetical protein